MGSVISDSDRNIVKGKNMAVTLNETPSANRLHIGIFGKTNSGKSSFINAFSGQKVSIVADVAGTTTVLYTRLWKFTLSVPAS